MPVAGSKVLESATKVSVQVIARLLMISERRVQQLANEGVIPRTESRRYNLEESVQAYIQFLQGKNVGRAMADEQIDFHEEKARLTKIQADKAQLELDEMARSLVKADDVSRQWYNAVADCKGRLLSIPSKAAPIVAAETSAGACKKIIDDLVFEALEELGSYGNSEREESDPEGDDSVEAATEADGEQLGGSKPKVRRAK
jgi:phage terminase Nu1 subunit (DNA packaging protein)